MDSIRHHVQKYNEHRLMQDKNLVCHAPFVSMNFEQTGKVTACCYNRTHVVGTYPANTVDEIWNSDKIAELRLALENLDFSKGCQKCEESLLSRNYFSPLMKNYDKLNKNGWEAARSGPRIFEFELSNLCNLECIMCNGSFSSSIRKNREKLPPLKFPWDDRFVEQLRPYWKNIEWAKFLGGEPFLNPLYFKIWDQIAEENPDVKVVITTNGTIMNSKVMSVLNRVKPMLVLSIDSFQKETYEAIRTKASYEETMKNLTIFINYAKAFRRTVDVVVCPMINNWRDLPEIFDWGIRNTIQVSFNTVHFPESLALQKAPKKKLAEVAKFLNSVDMPKIEDLQGEPTPWARTVSAANRNRYESLKAQVESWSREEGA